MPRKDSDAWQEPEKCEIEGIWEETQSDWRGNVMLTETRM